MSRADLTAKTEPVLQALELVLERIKVAEMALSAVEADPALAIFLRNHLSGAFQEAAPVARHARMIQDLHAPGQSIQ